MQNMQSVANWQFLIEVLTKETGFRIEDTGDGQIRIISADPQQTKRISEFLQNLTPGIFNETRVYNLNFVNATGGASTNPPNNQTQYDAPEIPDAKTAKRIFQKMFQRKTFATLNLEEIFSENNEDEPQNLMRFENGKLFSIAFDTKYVREVWLQMLRNIYASFNGVSVEQAQAALHGKSLQYQDVDFSDKKISTLLNECFFLYTYIDPATKAEKVRMVIDFERFKQFLWAPTAVHTQEQSEYIATLPKEHLIANLRRITGGLLFNVSDANPMSNQVNISTVVLSNTPSMPRRKKFIILADCSGSMTNCFETLKQKLLEIRDSIQENFSGATLEIVFFNNAIIRRFKYETIVARKLEQDMEHVVANGGTALYGSIEQVLTDIYNAEQRESSVTNLFVLTDGKEETLKEELIPEAQNKLETMLSGFETNSYSRPRVTTIGLGEKENYDEDLMKKMAKNTGSFHINVRDLQDLVRQLLTQENIDKIGKAQRIIELLVEYDQTRFTYHIPVEATGDPQQPQIVIPVPRDKPCVIEIGGEKFDFAINPERLERSQAKTKQEEKPISAQVNSKPLNTTIEYNEIKFGKELGKGGFGTVYKAVYQGQEVAVKMLNVQTDAAKEELKNEAEIMNRVGKSDYVVHVFGVCLESPNFCIVMEYMSGGDLWHRLHSSEDISWQQRYIYAEDIAKGLKYLHDCGILHRDLKSLNVLLTEAFKRAKLNDFGLGFQKTNTMTTLLAETGRQIGTPFWMAPETLNTEPKYTRESDKYSLAILYWELAHREMPYSGVNPAVVIHSVLQGERPKISEVVTKNQPRFAGLITLGWAQKPEDRANINTIIEGIEECQRELGMRN